MKSTRCHQHSSHSSSSSSSSSAALCSSSSLSVTSVPFTASMSSYVSPSLSLSLCLFLCLLLLFLSLCMRLLLPLCLSLHCTNSIIHQQTHSIKQATLHSPHSVAPNQQSTLKPAYSIRIITAVTPLSRRKQYRFNIRYRHLQSHQQQSSVSKCYSQHYSTSLTYTHYSQCSPYSSDTSIISSCDSHSQSFSPCC